MGDKSISPDAVIVCEYNMISIQTLSFVKKDYTLTIVGDGEEKNGYILFMVRDEYSCSTQ